MNIIKVVQVPIDALKSAKLQPKSRVSQSRVKAMAESLSRYGQLQPILVNQNDGRIILGHTRTAGAKEAGWSSINAILVPYSEKEAKNIFTAEARIVQPVKSFQYFEMFMSGGKLEELPKKHAADIKVCFQIFGSDLSLLLEKRFAPANQKTIHSLYQALYAHLGNETPSLKAIGFWCLHTGSVGKVYQAIKNGRVNAKTSKTIGSCIRKRKVLGRV